MLINWLLNITNRLSSGLHIPIDREYLRRAIVNVITNAVQALEDEESLGNELQVETGVAGDKLQIRIIDKGIGISEDIMENIFEPLFSTKSFGVGLGLPIVKDIMEEHGGGVEIQNEVAKETTVMLWLPIPDSEG